MWDKFYLSSGTEYWSTNKDSLVFQCGNACPWSLEALSELEVCALHSTVLHYLISHCYTCPRCIISASA